MAVLSEATAASQAAAKRAELIGGVCSWLVCSIGMLVFNKMAVQAVPLPCFLVASQMGFTVLILLIFCHRSLHIGSMRDVARWCMVVPFFLGMLLSSMFALKSAPMSLVVTFRALSPMFSLAIERLVFSKPPEGTLLSMWPLIVIIMGAALYARDVPQKSDGLVGIGWVMLNTFFALGDRLLQRRMLASDEHPVDISTSGVTLLNNLLGMIPLFFVAIYSGEMEKMSGVAENLGSHGVMWVIASCVVGVGISYTGILVQGMITATSFLVLVNANKFVIIILEVTCMKHSLTHGQLAGSLLAIVGSILWGCRGRDCGKTSDDLARCLGFPIGVEAPSDNKNRFYGAISAQLGSSEAKLPM